MGPYIFTWYNDLEAYFSSPYLPLVTSHLYSSLKIWSAMQALSIWLITCYQKLTESAIENEVLFSLPGEIENLLNQGGRAGTFNSRSSTRVATNLHFDTGTETNTRTVNQSMILCWANSSVELINRWSFCLLLFSYLVNIPLPESQKPKCLQRVRKSPSPQHCIHFWYSRSIPTGCTAQYQRKGAILIIAIVAIKP